MKLRIFMMILLSLIGFSVAQNLSSTAWAQDTAPTAPAQSPAPEITGTAPSNPDAPPADAAVASQENLPLAPQLQVETDEKFNYTQSGRDPFVSLVEPTEGAGDMVNQGGLPSMLIAELALQGIQIGLGKVGMFKGPDNNVYGMRIGDSCKDGKLIDIQNNKVMFEKIVFDEFGREKDKQQIEVYLHR